jgi:hypothetical protein
MAAASKIIFFIRIGLSRRDSDRVMDNATAGTNIQI